MPLNLLCFDNCISYKLRNIMNLISQIWICLNQFFNLFIILVIIILRSLLFNMIHLLIYFLQSQLYILLIKVTGHLKCKLISFKYCSRDFNRNFFPYYTTCFSFFLVLIWCSCSLCCFKIILLLLEFWSSHTFSWSFW